MIGTTRREYRNSHRVTSVLSDALMNAGGSCNKTTVIETKRRSSWSRRESARIARWVSIALVPPVPASIACTLYVYHFEHGSLQHQLFVLLLAILASGVLQIGYVLLLRRRKLVSAYDVPDRAQRTKPYLVSAFISLTGAVALFAADASIMVYGMLWCYAVNVLLLAAVNRYWKMSAHMMGLAGPLVIIVPLLGSVSLAAIPVLALLAWARVHIRAHTWPQVLAGTMAGILLGALQLFLLLTYGNTILSNAL